MTWICFSIVILKLHLVTNVTPVTFTITLNNLDHFNALSLLSYDNTYLLPNSEVGLAEKKRSKCNWGGQECPFNRGMDPFRGIRFPQGEKMTRVEKIPKQITWHIH